jgi:spore germination protein KB
VIGRASQAVFPLLIGSILLIVLLLTPEINAQELLPLKILVTGPVPHLQDLINVTTRTLEIVSLAMLVPSVDQPQGLWPATVRGLLWLGAIWVLMNITIIGVLGQDIRNHFFPFFAAVRLIHIADFLERIDSIFLAVWLFGMFLRVSLLLWSLAVGTAQWLRVANYRPLVLPLGAMALTYSLLLATSFNAVQNALSPEAFTPVGLLFILLLPLLLLVLAAMRGLGVNGAA